MALFFCLSMTFPDLERITMENYLLFMLYIAVAATPAGIPRSLSHRPVAFCLFSFGSAHDLFPTWPCSAAWLPFSPSAAVTTA